MTDNGQTTNNYSNGNGNGNGNGDAKLKVGVQQALTDNLKTIGGLVCAAIAAWYFANGSTQAEINTLKAIVEKRDAQIASINDRITRMDEHGAEVEVQIAGKGLEIGYEGIISEIRSHYHSQCPGASAYHRTWYPPVRIGKAQDG